MHRPTKSNGDAPGLMTFGETLDPTKRNDPGQDQWETPSISQSPRRRESTPLIGQEETNDTTSIFKAEDTRPQETGPWNQRTGHQTHMEVAQTPKTRGTAKPGRG